VVGGLKAGDKLGLGVGGMVDKLQVLSDKKLEKIVSELNEQVEKETEVAVAGLLLEVKPTSAKVLVRQEGTGPEQHLAAGRIIGPDGLKKNQKFKKPIITPTTKASEGHDVNISKEEAISLKLITEDRYNKIENYTYALFDNGSKMADKLGLILVDTKYEFGITNYNRVYLIDEIHTPDSSRYFEESEYQKRFNAGLPQKQLSKEFFREWLIGVGYNPESSTNLPELPNEVVSKISKLYISLYERLTGKRFIPQNYETAEDFCNFT